MGSKHRLTPGQRLKGLGRTPGSQKTPGSNAGSLCPPLAASASLGVMSAAPTWVAPNTEAEHWTAPRTFRPAPGRVFPRGGPCLAPPRSSFPSPGTEQSEISYRKAWATESLCVSSISCSNTTSVTVPPPIAHVSFPIPIYPLWHITNLFYIVYSNKVLRMAKRRIRK